MRLASDAVGRSSYKRAPANRINRRPSASARSNRPPHPVPAQSHWERSTWTWVSRPARQPHCAVQPSAPQCSVRTTRRSQAASPCPRPPRIEGVDAVRIGPNASTRTGRLGFGAADVRSGGVLGKRAASGGVAHGEGAVSMSTRAHRGTSRMFWKPIRAPECRPDRQKCRPDQSASAPWHCPGPAANRNANEAPGRLTPLPLARMPQRTPWEALLSTPRGASTGTLRRHPRHRLPRGFPGLTHDRLRIGGLYR